MPHDHVTCPACQSRARRGPLLAAFLAGLVVALSGLTAIAFAEVSPTPTPSPTPSLWDRAVSSVSETADRYTSDEAVADYIIASVAKQARINKILEKRDSSFRISELKVVVTVPPALEVGVTEMSDGAR